LKLHQPLLKNKNKTTERKSELRYEKRLILMVAFETPEPSHD
jgi:hypothetical protein